MNKLTFLSFHTHRMHLCLLSFCLVSVFSISQARADTAITITGSVVDNTCTLSPSTTSVTMTAARLSTLEGGQGSTAEPKTFDMSFTACGGSATSATITFSGQADTDDTQVLANTTSSNPAGGVGIALYDSDDTQLALSSGSAQAKAVDITTGSGSATYTLKYMATGATLTAGNVSATLNYTVTYA